MPVKVRCPECENVLTLPDQARGKTARCSHCDARVPVPAGKKKAQPPRGGAAGRTRKPAQPSRGPQDDGDIFSNLDLSRAEDMQVRVCPRCGLQVDEEDIECPKCGVDLTTGRLSAEKQRKKERGGPDPDKYYETFVESGWEFLQEHWKLGVRTAVYMVVPYGLALVALYFAIFFHLAPLIVTFTIVAMLCSLVGPGWFWHLHTTITLSAIDKNVKLDRINFDFFLCVALGIKYVVWSLVFNLPFLIVTGILGYLIGGPAGVLIYHLGYIPGFLCFPIAMAHMSAPVQWKAWASPIIIQKFFGGLAAPSLYWCMFAFLSMLTSMVIGIVIWFVSWSGLMELYADLQYNARIRTVESLGKQVGGDEVIKVNGIPVTDTEKRELDLTPALLGGGLFLVSMIPVGFACVFNARTNGLLVYYFRPELELIMEEKQVVWKRRMKHADDADFEDDYYGGAGAGTYATGIGGTIIFYIVLAVVSGFVSGGKVILLPRPIAQALNIIADQQAEE